MGDQKVQGKRHIEAKADAFFQAGELEKCPLGVKYLLEGMRKAGYDVLAAPFAERGNLRGVLLQVDGVPVIFYPADPHLAVLTVAHEVAHIALGHALHQRDRAEATTIYTDAQEVESEYFARYLVSRWQLAALRRRPDTSLPEAMTAFFHHL